DLVSGYDVRMIQRDDSARLLFEALPSLRMTGETQRQKFQCRLAARNGVGCEVDVTHATCPDSSDDLIATDFPTQQQIGLRIFEDLRTKTDDRVFNKPRGAMMRGKESLDLEAKPFIVPTGRFQKCADLLRVLVERGMEYFLD